MDSFCKLGGMVMWALCVGVMTSELGTGSSEVCDVIASRGSSLVQTFKERSERIISDVEVDDGAFCCMYATNQNDACGTCKAIKYGDTWCGRSEQNCKSCGERFDWCSATASGSTTPTPSPTEPVGDGFCCFAATDKSDTCGSCSSRAEKPHWCGASAGRCKSCGSQHTWCAGEPNDDVVTTQPTASPTTPASIEEPGETPTVAPTAKPTANPTRAPTTAPTSAPSPLVAPDGDWTGHNMKMTHYWDCSGQGCDAATLQPWNMEKFVSPPGYAPQDPADFGGSVYGEKMWLTGAASDALSALLGDDDACCGSDHNDGGVGGCGKCVLVQNPQSLHPDWTAVMMKKNRCPPWSNGCGAGEPHFDVAAPGFDNLQWSTANVCGKRADTGFDTQSQSAALGSWYHSCQNTAECKSLCDQLPSQFRKGCKLFASWGWTRGDPDQVKFKAVECPANFVAHVGSLFGANGATSQ